MMPKALSLRWRRASRRTAAALLATLSVCASHAQFGATPEDVTFNPAGFEQLAIPSQSCIGFMGQPDYHCTAVTVPAYLVHAKTGDHKALVLISEGAGGVDRRHGEYAKWLADHGISAAVLDHWSARGMQRAEVDLQKTRDKGGSGVNMTLDANAASIWFRDQPEWKDAKVGYLGESMGGAAALNALANWPVAMAKQALQRTPKDMDAVVALYPACIDRGNLNQKFKSVPFMLVAGEKDQITPAWTCEWQANRMNEHGGNVTFSVLPGMHHDWDAPWRLHMSQSENTSKCSNYEDGDKLILVSNGKTYPRNADGQRDMKNDCRSRGFLDGRQGEDWHVGYDVWTQFFIDKLLTSAN